MFLVLDASIVSLEQTSSDVLTLNFKKREREKEGEKEQYHWVWINVKKSERICYKFMKCLFICYLYRYSLENLTGQDTKIFNSKKDVLT